MKRDTVPISEKVLLTFSEAAEYFNVGENKLRTMATCSPDWILNNGSHKLIKRVRLEKYLLDSYSI